MRRTVLSGVIVAAFLVAVSRADTVYMIAAMGTVQVGSPDCNNNGIPDEQDMADCDGSPWCDDCNGNGVLDICDIDESDPDGDGTFYEDANDDFIPDVCQAVCCYGYICYDVDPFDPEDPHNDADCSASGGAYIYQGGSCADGICDCGGTDSRGDSDCLGDGPLSYDIDHFVQALGDPPTWISTHWCNYYCANDVNCDGEVDSYDIDSFILCVGQGVCEPCP